MINRVESVFNEPGTVQIIEDFKSLLTNTAGVPFTFDEVSMESIVDSFPTDTDKTIVFDALSIGIDKSVKTQNFFFLDLKTKRQANSDEQNNNLLFAWVNRVGHALLEQLEIRIGGTKIDRQYGDWLNIWYELTANRNMEEKYFKMIGNVSELTTFDRNAKKRGIYIICSFAILV